MIELNKQAKKLNKWHGLIGDVGDYVKDATPVGSRYICNPPPTNTDNDLLCLISENLWGEFHGAALKEGWKQDGDYPDSDFQSYRKTGTDVNLIATRYHSIYKDFKLAADVCKYLNLTNKDQRIAVHAAFIEHVSPFAPKQEKVLQQKDDPFAGGGVYNWAVNLVHDEGNLEHAIAQMKLDLANQAYDPPPQAQEPAKPQQLKPGQHKAMGAAKVAWYKAYAKNVYF